MEPIHGPAKPGEQRRSVISAARAAKELKWNPRVSLKDGLAQTFSFFKDRARRSS
jgi:UDP-glucose 4-epimerase